MLREVTNPNTPGRVVPELHEIAAWLAGMSPEFFEMLTQTDPEVLLRSDFASIGDVEREALVGRLLEMLDKKQMLDQGLWDRRTCRGLSHAKLAAQLEPYVVGRDKYFMARRAAIGIAEACEVVALRDALVNVALDSADDAQIRSRAAHAVVKIGDRAPKLKLRPLVFGECGPDPDDDLKGYAMEALWPKDLTTDELFANLTAPRQSNYWGVYRNLIAHHLPRCLRGEDLPRALIWTTELPPRHVGTSTSTLYDLMESVLRRAWDRLDDPAVLSAFAKAARARLDVDDGIFARRHHRDPAIVMVDDRRRSLLGALLDLPMMQQEARKLVSYHALVLAHDVIWVIEQMSAAPSSDTRTRWAGILGEIVRVHYWNGGNWEPIVAAWEGIAELRDALRDLFCDGFVDLDSQLATDLRRAERETEARRREYQKVLATEPNDSPTITPGDREDR
jgi:hypothetical protein